MTKKLLCLLLILSLSVPVSAMELTAPEVPESGRDNMPQQTDSFADALEQLMQKALVILQPEWAEASGLCSRILFGAMLFSLLPLLTDQIRKPVTVAATVAMVSLVLRNTGSMIGCGRETVIELCEYGKMLCPVLTTALAAQGGITVSSALYLGTTAFISFLSMLVSGVLVPGVYFFLTFSAAHWAMEEDMLKKFADATKNLLSWTLKTLLMVFTTYMSITGVISGTTDAAALKTAKVAISSVVPVVGGILSDASDSLLVSMAAVKNAAGVYGILAVLAVCMEPFVKIGLQYLLLKATSLLCSLFAGKHISGLLEDFSSAMGILLAMVAVGCVMVLFSIVCYLRGLA